MFCSLSRAVLQLICSFFLCSFQLFPKRGKLRRIKKPRCNIRREFDFKVIQTEFFLIASFNLVSIHLFDCEFGNGCKLFFSKEIFTFFTFLQSNKALSWRFILDDFCWNNVSNLEVLICLLEINFHIFYWSIFKIIVDLEFCNKSFIKKKQSHCSI